MGKIISERASQKSGAEEEMSRLDYLRDVWRKKKRMAGGGECGKEGSEDGGLGGKLKELYEDEKRRIVEKGIAGTIAEHKT